TYGYFHQVYADTQRLEGFPLGQIIKGKAEVQKQIEQEKEEKAEKEAKEERYKKAKITDPRDIDVTFNSIGGLETIKKICKNNAEAIRQKNSEPKKCFAEPEHMIFYGPPGTGKTLLAKAIAQASGSFFLNLSGNDFAVSIAQMLGNEKTISLEEKIRNIFNIAVQEAGNKTIVVLIDEIDQMGDALLRPGRLFQKYLINYPEPKDLLKIIEKVLGEYHDYIKKEKDAPELFGGLGKTAFINKLPEKLQTKSI
ncbi:12394_t:CDS:2, partial [Funneliformis geosporum]